MRHHLWATPAHAPKQTAYTKSAATPPPAHLACPLKRVVVDLLEAVWVLQLATHLTQLAAQLVNAVNAKPAGGRTVVERDKGQQAVRRRSARMTVRITGQTPWRKPQTVSVGMCVPVNCNIQGGETSLQLRGPSLECSRPSRLRTVCVSTTHLMRPLTHSSRVYSHIMRADRW
jgi:hypothetical protein